MKQSLFYIMVFIGCIIMLFTSSCGYTVPKDANYVEHMKHHAKHQPIGYRVKQNRNHKFLHAHVDTVYLVVDEPSHQIIKRFVAKH